MHPCYLGVQGFHRTYATGAACQQRTLSPPDTWSCPTFGLACVLMSRPNSPELVLFPDFWVSNIPQYFSFASHGWVVTFPGSNRTVFTFRNWLDLLGVVLAFLISILKISKLLQNCWHRVIDITSFEKHLESSLDHTPNFSRNLVIFRSKICVKRNLSLGLLWWSR